MRPDMHYKNLTAIDDCMIMTKGRPTQIAEISNMSLNPLTCCYCHELVEIKTSDMSYLVSEKVLLNIPKQLIVQLFSSILDFHSVLSHR